MKKVVKIASIVFISMLYCVAVGIVNYNLYNSPTTFAKEVNTEKGSSFSKVASKHFCAALQSESSVNVVHHNSPSTFKNPFDGVFVVTSAREQLFCHVFNQYLAYSQNLLIRFRKADIIFPFHYFW